ncbi:MAG: aldo/keto reductase [Bacteroidaceae bacterium]|nr:aldo/keto reductase [Bacteroidaceae bacterium]
MDKTLSRRNFLKYIAGGAAAAVPASTLLTGCKPSSSSTNGPDGASMTMRVNPNSGDQVSLLGYGMMRLPQLPEGSPDDPQTGPFDQEMINRQIDYALEHGVNYFDTAPVYCRGLSERCTGIALKRHPRDKYFIATKLSNFDSSIWNLEGSQKMFENSLKELQVDYVDYLLLHSTGGGGRDPETGENLSGLDVCQRRFIDNGLMDWLTEQKQKGRIRNLGFSWHGDYRAFELLLKLHDEGRYHWDFVQIELNYLDWFYANEINGSNVDAVILYSELEKRGIPAVIMEPLLGGRLANVNDAVAAELKERDPEATIASWAFRFAGSPQGVLTVLSGMTYMEHLQENVKTYSPLQPISEEEHEFLMHIAEVIYGQKEIPCTACQYCMPCPYGIDIPANFAHYNKCIREGNTPQSSGSPTFRSQRRAFLVGYDRSVPKLRQASHCIGCNQCTSHCPQQINIPRELRRLDEYAEELRREGGPL